MLGTGGCGLTAAIAAHDAGAKRRVESLTVMSNVDPSNVTVPNALPVDTDG